MGKIASLCQRVQHLDLIWRSKKWQATEKRQTRAMSQWWISALAAFAAIAIIVAVIVVSKFARMMRMK